MRLAFLLILTIPLILVSIWFKDGLILGTAEAEIPFYKLERFKDKASWSWTDFHLGNTAGLTIASAPSWWLLSKLQNLGIPGFIVQAFTFWFLLTSAGIGIYGLTKALFPKLSEKYLILAVLFYWFNPLSLVNVWNRFLYNYIVFFAVLPLLLFVYIWGLRQRKYRFSLVTALIVAFFAFAFTSYVFNLLALFLLIFTWIFLILTERKKEFIFFSIKFNLLTLIISILINAWWIIPTFIFIFAKDTSEGYFLVTPEGNLYTLNILSQKLGHLIDITRLMQATFYQNEGPKWASSYSGPLLSSLLFTVTGTIFWGIYRLRAQKEVLYLGLLFLLGIFFAKGNNQPFGGIFQFFFERINFLQVLRNPFEKFGFIIALATAPLFVVGVDELEKKLKKKISFLAYLVSLILVVGVLGFPFLSGLVFTSKSPPNDDYSIGFKVKVPEYYEEANRWLESRGRNLRFISFPLGDEGITYTWEKGYQGVEPSGILFSTSGITFNTSIPYYSQIAENLERLLFEGEDFSKVANLLNAKYFLVHYDIDIRERRLRDPSVIETLLENKTVKGEVKKVAQFGKLTFWENLKWIDRTVYTSTNLIAVIPNARISDALFQEVGTDDVLLTKDPEWEIKGIEGLEVIYPQEEENNTPNPEIQSFERQKKYHVNVNKGSDYELVLTDAYILQNEATLAAQFKVTVDDKQILKQSNLREDKKISFGKINLSAGAHEITIERPMSKNLVSAPENVSIKTIPDENQASFEIENFDPYLRYLVGFDYLIKSGQEFIFMFQQSNDLIRQGNIVSQYPYFNVLTKDNLNSFRHASGIYTPQRSEKAGILFWVDPSKNMEVVIKNVSVNRLIEPQPVLIKENPQVSSSPPPQITYVKHNPTKYTVRVNGASSPFILVLSELFNSGWEAIFDDNTSARTHFSTNAYANGWLIEKEGDFNLTLEFAPQRLLDKGKIISGVTVVLGLIYIGSVLIRKKGI